MMQTTNPMQVIRPRRRSISLAGPLVVLCLASACSQDSRDGAAAPEQTAEADVANSDPAFERTHYGTLESGEPVDIVTLANGSGVEVDILSYGGIITRIAVPDAEGKIDDIVLGLDSLDEYVASSPYFGAIIGRYGNRIANGRFELGGEEYQLSVNDGLNHLHGGAVGFDKLNWDMQPFVTENSAGVTLSRVSPDGDQGYPGTLDVEVVYELTDLNEVELDFSATTDKPTVVNLTHHSYFNLAGSGDILGHRLEIPADYYTPVRDGLIPTGELAPVDGTPFDFREAKPIGRDIAADNEQLQLGLGYDHNWVINTAPGDELLLLARLSEPTSGRILEVWSTEPGLQFYSGNFLDGTLDGKGVVHGRRSGLCLEPQHYPDSPNQPDFPSTTLEPGDRYGMRIVYKFRTTAE